MRDNRPSRSSEDLLAPATQWVADSETYLGQGAKELGRRISATQHELFAVADAPSALAQSLEVVAAEFVTLHDLPAQPGQGQSMHWLRALDRTGASALQTLSIRRQGHGRALAVLHFVELQATDQTRVRIYSSEIEADDSTQVALSHVLMAHSRVGMMLVGDMSRFALGSALAPWREAIARGPWCNRDLVLVPLAALPTLASEAATVPGRSGVTVNLAPITTQADEAFLRVAQAWNRVQTRHRSKAFLSAPAAAMAPGVPSLPSWEERTQPMGLRETSAEPALLAPVTIPVSVPLPKPTLVPTRPTPVVPFAASTPILEASPWPPYAQQCAAIRGVLACCVFDQQTHKALAYAGRHSSGDLLASQGAQMMAAVQATSQALGPANTVRDTLINLGKTQLLLHPITGHAPATLHIVLDTSTTSAAMVRAQLERFRPSATP